jgi:hypothetical protein
MLIQNCKKRGLTSIMRHVCFLWYVLEASLMMTPCGRNTGLNYIIKLCFMVICLFLILYEVIFY